MKVLNKFILIEKIAEERKTVLLMTVDDKKELRYSKAKVISVGPMVSGITDANEIYFDKAAGHDVLIDDKRFTVVQEKDVVCVL